jgi:hypothetical protein
MRIRQTLRESEPGGRHFANVPVRARGIYRRPMFLAYAAIRPFQWPE